MTALTREGELYVWGTNSYAQLGLGDLKDRSTPTLNTLVAELVGKVERVITAGYHTMVLTKGGALWIWGYGTLGCQGRGPDNGAHEPMPHRLFEKGVVQVASGWSHTLVLMDDGSVWAWGNNADEQCGFAEGSSRKFMEPTKIEFRENVRGEFVGCGNECSFMITDMGELWMWGGVQVTRLDFQVDRKPQPFPGRRFFVPGREWRDLFRWVWAGWRDRESQFFSLPIEVVYHMVQVRYSR
jgi:alpha-tubulin suppressor-like RCC1 family protein